MERDCRGLIDFALEVSGGRVRLMEPLALNGLEIAVVLAKVVSFVRRALVMYGTGAIKDAVRIAEMLVVDGPMLIEPVVLVLVTTGLFVVLLAVPTTFFVAGLLVIAGALEFPVFFANNALVTTACAVVTAQITGVGAALLLVSGFFVTVDKPLIAIPIVNEIFCDEFKSKTVPEKDA